MKGVRKQMWIDYDTRRELYRKAQLRFCFGQVVDDINVLRLVCRWCDHVPQTVLSARIHAESSHYAALYQLGGSMMTNHLV